MKMVGEMWRRLRTSLRQITGSVDRLSLREPVVAVRWSAGEVIDTRLFTLYCPLEHYVVAEAVEDYNDGLEYGEFGEIFPRGAKPIEDMTMRGALVYWRFQYENVHLDNYLQLLRLPHRENSTGYVVIGMFGGLDGERRKFIPRPDWY